MKKTADKYRRIALFAVAFLGLVAVSTPTHAQTINDLIAEGDAAAQQALDLIEAGEAAAQQAQNLVAEQTELLLQQQAAIEQLTSETLNALSPEALVETIQDLPADLKAATLDKVSAEAEEAAKQFILESVPPEIQDLIANNPLDASLEELSTGLDNLLNSANIPDEEDIRALIGDAFEDLTGEATAAFLSILPEDIATILPDEIKLDALQKIADEGIEGLKEFFGEAGEALLAELPLEEFFEDLPIDDVLELFADVPELSALGDEFGQVFEEALGPGLFAGSSLVIPLDVYLGDTHLDTALERLVLSSLKTYVDSNFAHDYLGGTAGFNNDIADVITVDSYQCETMQEIWHLAKCRNFGLDDVFLSFEDLIDNDPRIQPAECTGGTTITQEHIDLANNVDFQYASFDPIVTYLYLLVPPEAQAIEEGGDALVTIACAVDPIPTGISVNRYTYVTDDEGVVTRETETFDDKICSNPGCYYQAGDDTCNID